MGSLTCFALGKSVEGYMYFPVFTCNTSYYLHVPKATATPSPPESSERWRISDKMLRLSKSLRQRPSKNNDRGRYLTFTKITMGNITPSTIHLLICSNVNSL